MDYVTCYPEKPDGRYCSSCQAIKPIADFKRRATLAQTRVWLKNEHAKRPIEYEGKTCNACYRRRKPSDLSPEELRKRMVNEGENPLKIQAQVEAHYAKGKAQRKQKQTKARAERYAGEYKKLLTALATKLRKTSEHLRYARRANKPAERIESLEETVRNLRTQRDRIRAARRDGRDPTSLGNVTQNPAVPLTNREGEPQ